MKLGELDLPQPVKPGVVEKWASFEAWRLDGYGVIKGAHSYFKSPTGVPLFNQDQVREIEESPYADLVPGEQYD